MNVNISKKTESKLVELARERGQEVADIAGAILEEKMRDTEFKPRGRKKLSDFSGIFYGGDGRTAENASENIAV